MSLTLRHKWMINKIMETFNVDEDNKLVETFFAEQAMHEVTGWLKGNVASPVIFFYDTRYEKIDPADEKKMNESFTKEGLKDKDGADIVDLKCTTSVIDGMRGKIGYFLRQSGDKPVNMKIGQDTTVSYGELTPGLLGVFKTSLESAYLPLIQESADTWGKLKEEKKKAEFFDQTSEFITMLAKQLNNLKGDAELKQPAFNFDPYDLKPAVYAKLAGHGDLAKDSVILMQGWYQKIKGYLTSNNPDTLGELQPNEGPRVEIEYWGRRLLTLQSVLDQLKTKAGKGVQGVVLAFKKIAKDDALKDVTDLLTAWSELEPQLNDAMNEAADNVKFLSNFDKFLEPLTKGTPMMVQDALPTLMSAMKMVYTLSRHYGTPQRMTGLFLRMTNEMIANCRRYLNGGDRVVNPKKIWTNKPADLIANFKMCIGLMEAYKKEYQATKEKLLTIPKGRQFTFDE